MNSPCWKCESRTIGCHGVCAKYKGYKTHVNILRTTDTIKYENALDNSLTRYRKTV